MTSQSPPGRSGWSKNRSSRTRRKPATRTRRKSQPPPDHHQASQCQQGMWVGVVEGRTRVMCCSAPHHLLSQVQHAVSPPGPPVEKGRGVAGSPKPPPTPQTNSSSIPPLLYSSSAQPGSKEQTKECLTKESVTSFKFKARRRRRTRGTGARRH